MNTAGQFLQRKVAHLEAQLVQLHFLSELAASVACAFAFDVGMGNAV